MTGLDGDDGASLCKVIVTHEGSADSGLTNMFSTADVKLCKESVWSLSTMSDAGDV